MFSKGERLQHHQQQQEEKDCVFMERTTESRSFRPRQDVLNASRGQGGKKKRLRKGIYAPKKKECSCKARTSLKAGGTANRVGFGFSGRYRKREPGLYSV